MGFFDTKLRFSDGQSITETAASTYEIDCGLANPNLGDGTPLVIECEIEYADAASGTSMTIELQHSAAGSSYATLVQYPAIVTASLTKGAKFQLMVPKEHLRYLQLYYTIVGTFDAGKITAYIQPAM